MLTLLPGYGEHVIPAATISAVILGMIVLAALDVWRREVEDYAIIALLAIALVGMDLEGIRPDQYLSGALAAAIAFAFYLTLAHRGAFGGGDVKLSIVPALVLGASSPVVGLWWIACTIVINTLFHRVNARVLKAPAAMPHVPAMALATLLASIAFPVSI